VNPAGAIVLRPDFAKAIEQGVQARTGLHALSLFSGGDAAR
jgi:hypothetical protein